MKDKIQDAFDHTPHPPLNEVAKQRSKRAAMAAFREEMQKKPTNAQGNQDEARLTRKQPNARKDKMPLSTKKVMFGGLAACCMVTIGALTFNQSLKDRAIPATGPVSDFVVERKEASPQPSSTPAKTRVDKLDEALVSAESDQSSVANVSLGKTKSADKDESVASVLAPMLEGEVVATRAKRALAQPLVKHAAPASAIVSMDRSRVPVREVENRDEFKKVTENSVHNASTDPVSTFSIDVDTASYSFMRRQLNRGVLPPKDAIRIEELINYFDYDYPLPADKSQPFEPTVVVSDSPWTKGNKLVHIGIKGYDIPEGMQPDSNLVFLLDVSGSMGAPDRLPLVKQSMGLLLDTLKPTDTVAIVVYAGAAGSVLEPTQVKHKDKILAALNRLNAGGSTAGGAGLSLAYDLAQQNFKKESVNRIILATDGDFNVGVTQEERLEDFVKRKREAGVYLSVLGFGEGNYHDALMQTLAQNGNGIAAYIDTLSEAQKLLVDEATSSLFPIANDVKIQVEFNPKLVKEYRLIGYETRALKREDFNNDKVDSGDIGAGHTVTAIYEITPVGSNSALVDDLRYSKVENKKSAMNRDHSGEYGFLKMRYKLPGQKTSQLITKPISVGNTQLTDKKLQQSIGFATAVSAFGQLLKGSDYVQHYRYDDVIQLAQANKGEDEFGYRTEFVQLVRRAKLSKAL